MPGEKEALAVKLSAIDDFSTIFGKMSRGLDGLVNNHKKLFIGMVAGAAIVSASVVQFAKYERQLAKVNTMLSHGEAKFLPGYAKAMKRLAATYGQSTETLSDGLYDILSASRGAEDAIKILAATTRAAVGGFTDVSVATAGALTTLNAFKLENSAIESVLDKQFATVKRGRLTYEQYANTIGTLAATSSLAGQSIESMNAAVATVTRGGIVAERAIVAINGAMLSFIKPSKAAASAAKKFNIDLSQQAIEGDNLGKTLEKLKDLRADELAQIFVERRAFKAMAVLTQNYAGFMRDLGEQHNSVGRMAEAAAKAEDTLAFQTERSIEIFKNAGRAIGGSFAPALKKALTAFNNFMKKTDPDIWLSKQKEALEAHEKLLAKTFSKAGKIKLSLDLGISVQDLEEILAVRNKLLDSNISDATTMEIYKKTWEDVREEIVKTEADIAQVKKTAEFFRVPPGKGTSLLSMILGGETEGGSAQLKHFEARLVALTASAAKLRAKLDNEAQVERFLRRAGPLTEEITKSNIETEKSLAKQAAIQAKILEIIKKAGEVRAGRFAKYREESLARVKSLETGINDVHREALLIEGKRKTKHEEQVELQAKKRRSVREERDLYREILIDQVAAAKADKKLNDQRSAAAESLRILSADTPAPVSGAVPLGPEVPDSVRLLNEHIALNDGKLESDQSYWASVSELMRVTYEKQTTFANEAATQTAAFVESAFGTLENELMKATNKRNLSMKKIGQAIEMDAKKSAIRTVLEVTKNKLKSIFITKSAEDAAALKAAVQAKLLRKEAYLSEMLKTTARVFGNTYSAISAIPFIGPALAPAAATAAKATVTAAMAPAAALHGGIDEVPFSEDNKSYILKGGERVLQPAANKEFMSLMEVLKGSNQGNVLGDSGSASNITVNVTFGSEELKGAVVSVVNEASRDGDLNIDPRAITT